MPRTYRPPRWCWGDVRPLPRVLHAPVFAALALACVLSAPAHAAGIGVSPTLIDLNAGQPVSGLRVSNSDAAQPVSVQVRIVRWRQDGSGNVYLSADGVVASPPVTRIQPGAENLIRIVRTAKHPVAGEESYRLLVDELPEPGRQQAGAINLMIRHSVPVFFSAADATPAQPQWRIARAQQDGEGGKNGGWKVSVANHGDRRLRLTNLDIYADDGALIAERQGLVGYVLGHSSMDFFIPDADDGEDATARAATALRLSAQSEHGPIDTGLLPVASP